MKRKLKGESLRGRRSKNNCLLYTVQTRCEIFHHINCKVWKLVTLMRGVVLGERDVLKHPLTVGRSL